jgi:hypothetical protein
MAEEKAYSLDEDCLGTLRAWFKIYKRWLGANYAGVIAIGAGSALAAVIDPPISKYISSAVTVLTVVYASTRPAERARSYREAWLILGDALAKYRAGPNPDPRSVQLIEARSKGEAVLSEVPAASPATSETKKAE